MKTDDYILEFHGEWAPGGEVRVRLYESDFGPVVVFSQVSGNTNTVPIVLIEHIAERVLQRHWPDLVPDIIAHVLFFYQHPAYAQRPNQQVLFGCYLLTPDAICGCIPWLELTCPWLHDIPAGGLEKLVGQTITD